jgi:hypothetical protein
LGTDATELLFDFAILTAEPISRFRNGIRARVEVVGPDLLKSGFD